MAHSIKVIASCLIMTCLVLSTSLAQADQKKPTAVPFYTAKEISNLSKEMRIKYIKALRDAVAAAEQVQQSFYGSDLFAVANSESRKSYETFFLQALVGEAWANEEKNSSQQCIIAGNAGVLKGGRCTFEDGIKTHKCDGGKGITCNPALYGEGICIPFSNKEERANATANCGKQDPNLEKVFNHYFTDADKAAEKLKDLEATLNNLENVCSKPKTKDQKQTCKNLIDRLDYVRSLLCDSAARPGSTQELNTKRDAVCAGIKGLKKEQEKRDAEEKKLEDEQKKLASNCESTSNDLARLQKKIEDQCDKSEFHNKGGLAACYKQLHECSGSNSYASANSICRKASSEQKASDVKGKAALSEYWNTEDLKYKVQELCKKHGSTDSVDEIKKRVAESLDKYEAEIASRKNAESKSASINTELPPEFRARGVGGTSTNDINKIKQILNKYCPSNVNTSNISADELVPISKAGNKIKNNLHQMEDVTAATDGLGVAEIQGDYDDLNKQIKDWLSNDVKTIQPTYLFCCEKPGPLKKNGSAEFCDISQNSKMKQMFNNISKPSPNPSWTASPFNSDGNAGETGSAK